MGRIIYHSSGRSSAVSTTVTVANGITGTKVNTNVARANFLKKILSLIPRKELLYAHAVVKFFFSFLPNQLPTAQIAERLHDIGDISWRSGYISIPKGLSNSLSLSIKSGETPGEFKFQSERKRGSIIRY